MKFIRTWAASFLFFAVANGFADPPGKQTGDGLTADELMNAADAAYQKRNFAEAAGLYQKFFDDFGKAKEPQIVEVIRRRTYNLALCHVSDKNFAEAVQSLQSALTQNPPHDPGQIQELTFWLGVAQMQEKDYAEAVKTLQKFLTLFPPEAINTPSYAKQYPATAKIPEAEILIGTGLMLDEKFADAAKFFEALTPRLNASERGRATVLGLYCHLQAGDHDGALEIVEREYPQMDAILQLVAFQTMTLELGSHFLEKGECRKAILCLQRVWPSERLLKHQQNRLADLESRLAAAEASPQPDPYLKIQLGLQITKLKREIEGFQKIENFDSALRLRLATAYQRMNRFRESALLMESMLEEMPPDPLVEAASVNLVQSWGQIERWPKVIGAAKQFREIFPDSQQVPLVWYLQGIAEQKSFDYAAATSTFDELAKSFPKSEFAPRAQFMKGFSLLLAEDNPGAVAAFDEFLKKHPKHELSEAGEYWRGMGFSLNKEFETARDAMSGYLKHHKKGSFASAAFFRKAYCAQQLEDYSTSIKELKDYLRKYPAGDETSEARILLGDALMNEGEMEDGIAAFEGIPPKDTRFYEEGVFKTAKALKLMEEYDRMEDHLQAFLKSSPRSPRVAEAIFHLGWIHRQKGNPEKARDIYWQAIEEHGNDPAIRSVDDLFPALAKLYKGPDEQARYLAKLRDLEESSKRKETLRMRALWARASALKKSDPEQAAQLLMQASKLANVQETNPLLLADFAEALMASGKEAEGEALWRDLVKWNPRAPQKDRALAGLGFIELQRGNEKAALDCFDRFERETSGSLLIAKVTLARAALLEKRGEKAEARKSLETLLESQFATGPEKCEALYRMGESYMKSGKPQLAIPYFQRIYVMHGRWREWVAKAYYRSGEAFEKLDDNLSARRTYQELSDNADLAEFKETAKARKKLEALGGPLTPESPNPQPEPAG